MKPYNKPYLTIDQQLELLRVRGMTFDDRERAASILRTIGYYRLSGYWYPCRQSRFEVNAAGKPELVPDESFRPGTALNDVLALYVFDKKLRLLFLDAIERIEIGLRVDVALIVGEDDPLAHRRADLLHGNFSKKPDPRNPGKTRHEVWLDRMDQIVAKSKEDFVVRYRSKYNSPLPIWIAIELWDFGMFSHFVSGLSHRHQTMLANKYGVPRPELLASWLRNLNYVRNICAHHGRLWNRNMVDEVKPLRRGEIALLDHLVGDSGAQARLYTSAAIMRFLLRQINPSTSWAERFASLLATFPVLPGTRLTQIGMPSSWHRLPLWSEDPRRA